MSLAMKLLQGVGVSSAAARATDLDGTNDYLSRSSDFTGNTDSKTFTFSFWGYTTKLTTQYVFTANAGNQFFVNMDSLGRLNIRGGNSAPSVILDAQTAAGSVPTDTFIHVLVSINLANPSERYIYLNDTDITPSTVFDTYTDDIIEFSSDSHFSGRAFNGVSRWEGRLTDVFLDYTYRDLSIEANRRLFSTIDPDLGLVPVAPSALAALNPIFTAFTNPDDLTENLGTGGAWTQNGVMARSNRGPNQYNAVASEVTDSQDLSHAGGMTGAVDSKVFTASLYIGTFGSWMYGLTFGDDHFGLHINSNGSLFIRGRNSSNTIIFNETVPIGVVVGRNYCIQVTMNTADSGDNHIIVNGVEISHSWTVTDAAINFTNTSQWVSRSASGTFGSDGIIGEVYLITTLIDLALSNPFYDIETSKPKYLGELGEIPTGSQPLIYLPINASMAGDNRGSGGDFTVNG